MTHRPTPRRFTGTPPTRGLRLGDAPYPTLLFSSRRLWPRPRSSASTDGASWRWTLSSARSGRLGCHDDHSRLLGQPHSRVEQAHQPVLHHPDNGHGATVAKMRLQGARRLAGRTSGRGSCGSEASCSSRALRRSLLRSGWGVGMGVASQSVGGDDEDRRLVDLSEHVRNLLVLPVVSPDHPDPAAGWHLGKHPQGAADQPPLAASDASREGCDGLTLDRSAG